MFIIYLDSAFVLFFLKIGCYFIIAFFVLLINTI